MSESRTFILRNELNAKALWDVLRTWQAQADAQKPIQVVVSGWRPIRSGAQNRRYFAILGEIQEVSRAVKGQWYSIEVWHQHMKDRFAPKIEGPDGSPQPMSTKDMTVEEFSDFMQQVEVFAVTEMDLEF